MSDGIRRRGILGLIAALPVAGPAVAQDVTGRSLLGLGASALKITGEGSEDDDDSDSDDENYEKQDEKSHYRDCIKTLIKNQRDFCSKPLHYYIRRVSRLDSDLQTNRSLALQTKIREQARRDRALAIQEKQAWTLENIIRYRGYMKG